MNFKSLEEYLLKKSGARLDYPFGEDVAVYKTGEENGDKMFALVREKKDPLQISLKCDPNLAKHLREQYDEVQPGYHLNKKHWNTIVLTGQLGEKEILELIDHSYDLATTR